MNAVVSGLIISAIIITLLGVSIKFYTHKKLNDIDGACSTIIESIDENIIGL